VYKIKHLLENTKLQKTRRTTFVMIFFNVPYIKPLRTTLERVWMGLLLNCSCTGLSFGRSPTHDDPQNKV
jgi:hypothetical protein